jgi:uncharacterized protein YfaS (alpha-2-macroglobulin family)
MRSTPRLGLILSSAILATLGAPEARREIAAAEAASLRVVDRGDGERVWVRFDRPMVEPEGVGSPAPLEVDLPGRALWVTVATALFTPQGPPPPSRSVTVRMGDVTAVDGTRLAHPVAWTFRTPGLSIDTYIPSVVGTRPHFELKFDHKVDPAKLAERAWFANATGVVDSRVVGMAVEPEKPLPFDSAWTFVIDRLVAEDGAELGTWKREFRVCSPFHLKHATGSSDVGGPNAISLEFSSAPDAKELHAKLSVRPKADFSISTRWGGRVTLTGAFEAGAAYWVQVADGLHDEYGNTLEAVTATVAIPAYSPALSLLERGSYLEVHGPLAVPLFCVNVPEAQVIVKRLPVTPWDYEGEALSDVTLTGNREPNETFTHGIALPGPGHYRVSASAPDIGLQTVRYYQVTDLALTFKLGGDRSLACVTSFETAQPVPGAILELFDEKGGLLRGATADAGGLAWFTGESSLENTPRYLVASRGDDVAWLDLGAREISPWRLPVRAEHPGTREPLDIFMFTDRPIYRAGETVHVKGWWKGATPREVRLELREGRSELLESVVRPLSPANGFDATFRLNDQARGGTYEIVAVVGDRRKAQSFEVGAYRVPTFEVKVKPSLPYGFPKERFEAVVEARTYSGVPLAGALVQWCASIEGQGEGANGRGVLDRDGRFQIAYTLGSKGGPLTLSATVTDAAHQSVSAETSAMIHPSEFVIHATTKKTMVEAGAPVEFEYSVKRVDGVAVDRVVAMRFVRRTWSQVQQLTAGRGWSYTWEHRDDLVAAEFATDGRWTVTPRKPGPHMLQLMTVDTADRETTTELTLDVVGPGEASWSPRNDFVVDLVPDRELYKAGETARVLVRNTPAGSRALVTLEREGVSEARWMEVPSNQAVIEVPIRGEQAPNVHLGVLLVRGRTGDALGPDGDDRGRPCFRCGYVTLAIDTASRRLPVEVKTVARALPGSEVTVEIVTAPGAEVTLSVVDQAVLALLDTADPDPHEVFNGPRPLRVITSEARPDLAVHRPLDVRGKKGRPGGGGGDGDKSHATRKNFKGTAYWNARLEADPSGHATVKLTLPDNLTRWRVIAVAASEGGFGTGHATLEVAKPLMIVSALPRFACLGDSFEARWVVHNRTGAAGRVLVEMDGEVRDMEMSDGATAAVTFPVKAGTVGPRRFRALARLGVHEDRLEITLPVRYPSAMESILLSGRIRRIHQFSLPPFARIDSVELLLGRSALVPMEGQLRQLLDYPHGCVEQTTSKTIPLLACRGLGIEGTDEKIAAGIRRLLSMQTSSGGLAYWPGESDPHPAGSVYATHALVLAARGGFDVPRPALDRALKYVEGMLREGVGTWQTYALYVLALAGRRHEAYLQSLERDPFLALAAIEMGLPERARDIPRRPHPAKVLQGEVFHSLHRERCAAVMAKVRLGENPGVSLKELMDEARLTYERAWTILAMGEMAGVNEGAGTFARIFVDGQRVCDASLREPTRLSLAPGKIRIETDGDAWATLRVKGQRPGQAAEDHGFWLRRTYTRVGESSPRLDFKPGDLVVVRVTLASKTDRAYVALEDPLPAGFEPVDLRFHTKATSRCEGCWFSYEELRDDRVFASENRMLGITELVYLARATTVGAFTAPAPRAEEMYSPETWGRGPSATVTIR